MGSTLDLVFYNPDQLEDEDFLNGFVARRALAEKILARLGAIKPRGLGQHRLIVGQRGMGKTSLLRRIALGVRNDPALAAVLLPLRFREEQYNVHNLHAFWTNCLDALGDWFEAEGRRDEADSIDRDVAKLDPKADDEHGSQALDLFLGWMKKEKRRPLLLLDNLDIIFDGLKDAKWSLRRVLQKEGGIVIVGASVTALEATALQKDAFFDFFQVDVLAKLEHHEILLCLRHIAQQRDEAGRRVLEILDRDPARIHALYDLTGGNPRTLALLYLVLETSGDDGVMKDLERLLDQATPLYKARVEELAPQARVVFDALALAWDPAPVSDLAETTGLEAGTVSAQLDRLVRDGVAEKATLSSTRRAAFQVAERFFNIWYLMRHSPRRQRLRLRWLTELLRKIYSPRELHERATVLCGLENERSCRAEYCLALSDAVSDRELRAVLRGSMRNAEGGFPLEEHFGLAIGQAPELSPAAVDYEETIEIYLKAITSKPHDVGLLYGYGKLLTVKAEGRKDANSVLRSVIELEPSHANAWKDLGWLLSFDLEQQTEAAEALQKAIELDPRDLASWNNLGILFARQLDRASEAEYAFRKAIEIDPKVAALWSNWGLLLADRFERFSEAEDAYRKAIELDPKFAEPWHNLGRLLEDQLECYPEAEEAYQKAIKINSRFAGSWHNLGRLLANQLKRYPEAEIAYRRAIELDPLLAEPWHNLGRLLANRLGRYSEAESAYRKAIELDPNDEMVWNNLGVFLVNRMERFSEAEVAYLRAIELDPNLAGPWNNLGILLARRPDRYSEAEVAFQKAIELDPKSKPPWINLASLLTDRLERFSEAEVAYRKIIELAPKDARLWLSLGWLLACKLERYPEAEAAYRKSLQLDPENAETWNNLGNLLADHLSFPAQAEQAYLEAFRLDPNEPLATANLAYLLLRQEDRMADAEPFYRTAVAALPSHGAGLLRAFCEVSRDNFGAAVEELRAVLEEGHEELFTTFRDDLLRILQLASERGYGEKLLAWFESSGLGARYWPLQVAFDAYLHGEERLMDVNPEVRSGARRLFTEMSRRPRGTPEESPEISPKKARRKKGGR